MTKTVWINVLLLRFLFYLRQIISWNNVKDILIKISSQIILILGFVKISADSFLRYNHIISIAMNYHDDFITIPWFATMHWVIFITYGSSNKFNWKLWWMNQNIWKEFVFENTWWLNLFILFCEFIFHKIESYLIIIM